MEYSPSLGIQVEEAGMKYAGRGDTGAPDFADGDFTKDGAPHILDLSAIVPEAGASHLVLINFELDNVGIDPGAIMFAMPGTSGAPFAQSSVTVPVAGLTVRVSNMWVLMDADRKIQYTLPNTTTIHWGYVRGWLEG